MGNLLEFKNPGRLIRISLFALTTLVYIALIGQDQGRSSFGSATLEHLFLQLPDELQRKINAKSHSSPGIFFVNCQEIHPNQVVKFEYDQNNLLVHLGLNIFLDSIQSDATIIQNYLERILLTLALIPDRTGKLRYLVGENLVLFVNRLQVTEKNISPLDNVYNITTEAGNNIRSGTGFVNVAFELPDSTLIELWFPKDYNVISGKEKDEIEKEIVRELSQYKSNPKPSLNPDPSGMTQTGALFRFPGATYLGQKNINADLWFSKNQTNGFDAVFSPKACKESFANLLLNALETDHRLTLKIHLYGNQETSLTLSVNDFLGYFAKSHQFFLGWQSDNPEHLIATLFLKNNDFDYFHLLIAESDSKDLFTGSEPVRGDLYVYIPQNNLTKTTFTK